VSRAPNWNNIIDFKTNQVEHLNGCKGVSIGKLALMWKSSKETFEQVKNKIDWEINPDVEVEQGNHSNMCKGGLIRK
jgi:hypothetical protein